MGLEEALLTSTRFWQCYIIMLSLGPGLWLIKKESDPHLHKLLQTPLFFAIIAVGRTDIGVCSTGAGEPVSAVIIWMINSEIIVCCAGKTEQTVLHCV